ncbi:MAG: transcription antitermination factor NusB [Acidobacteria bacterium]|nr:MAG: transcription antitermination factor NusB [Acidobacteriota bacterium]RPJ73632.1 MAG: transcription antitermination factor NusB [Acidobacteriota bacterium]
MTEARTEWQRERRRAREAALQMLYQCDVGGLSAAEAIAAYAEIDQPGRVAPGETADFAVTLVEGTTADLAQIDPIIEASSEHWRLARMSVVDRTVLRLAVYQFLHEPDIPHPVVIDESVELARRYGGEESSRFVNGVLDAVRRKLAAGPSRPTGPES